MKLNNYLTLVIFIALTAHGCAQTPTNMKPTHTNALISETSPYLLQHAHNPVNWMPYGKEAMEKAKAEDKLIIMSIGYSACHWCHVMEHESFEDSAVADLMNTHFVSIKIDREERPDLDNFYMGAVQLMTGRGGWPLNCITLPDGRPIWGGTYFQKQDWINALQAIQNVFKNDRPKVLEYANQLQDGIAQSDLVPANHTPPDFTEADLQDLVENWKRRFDTKWGGPDKAPKFPLPNNYQFLLRYAWLSGDEAVENQVKLTLQEMAFGGIYDQVGGGFARYSTDEYWKAPHFEKMLYDNAQLISLYSEAYRAYKNNLYKEIVEETIGFLEREMLGDENQFYAALDADSEGEEGKYYVWTETELQAIIPPEDWDLFEEYYNINSRGRWENKQYILLRNTTDSAFAIEHKMYESTLKNKVTQWNNSLLNVREKRVKPGLDNKALTAWNALTIKAFVDAYIAFENPKYLELAERTATFIKQKLTQNNGHLWHTYSPGEAKIDGFLDDYATTIEAWISLYQATGNQMWLNEAQTMTKIVLQNFDAGDNSLFHYTPKTTELLSRTTEISDNVIPASNSIMAHNLDRLGIFLANENYRQRAKKMAMQIKPNMYSYGEGFSNWTLLMLQWIYPTYEVVIAGPDAQTLTKEFNQKYYPNILQCMAQKPSCLPLFENRWMKNETIIYVCEGNVCQMPTKKIAKAWSLIKK